MVAPPGLPTQETNKTPNTTNVNYSRNIQQRRPLGRVAPMPRSCSGTGTCFSLSRLNATLCPTPSQSLSISTEPMFAVRFTIYIQSRLRRALRTGLFDPEPNMGLTPVTVDIGDTTHIIDDYRPDIAFFQAGGALNSSPNRCPGDL